MKQRAVTTLTENKCKHYRKLSSLFGNSWKKTFGKQVSFSVIRAITVCLSDLCRESSYSETLNSTVTRENWKSVFSVVEFWRKITHWAFSTLRITVYLLEEIHTLRQGEGCVFAYYSTGISFTFKFRCIHASCSCIAQM